MEKQFLPVTREEMHRRGWERLDFIIVSGDAYVDHPSFGVAIIGRYLEARGFKVGIIPQPDWRDPDAFKRLGRPKLAFLVTAGNVDSMVNHYTAARRRRKSDAYSPGGKAGRRPDRATIVYARKIREAYKKVPIILGGIEASLRRLAHYDYWEDRLRRSILLDAGADLLVYGMGERAILEIAEGLESGLSIKDLTYVRGTVYQSHSLDRLGEKIILPSYDELLASRELFARSFMIQYRNADPANGLPLVEPYRDGYVIQNPPAEPLTPFELDSIYLLPYTRTFHPIYEKEGGVPALTEVKFSLVSSRGCFGGCSFCALAFHQGRTVQARSIPGLLEEAAAMVREPDFKGYIHDVGGPTANFRKPACRRQKKRGPCPDRLCLFPRPCPSLEVDHSEYLELLRELRKLPGVKKVFIRSGIRYDYLLYDPKKEFFEELCRYHVSGQLKVAPEHVDPVVLEKMGKPGPEVFERFKREYRRINEKYGLRQYLVPYFISGHPGSNLQAAIRLAEYIRDMGVIPLQVQDFYPTPGTLSTCMYYTGLDPRTMEKVHVPRSREKAMQRALLQYNHPRSYRLVYRALKEAGREDLIGFRRECLIRPPGRKRG
ncbi:MAG TPA: YgiQ family radical SAM protein [Bacillota bacterium]|nr:YgiQ family radical SAM protein [Bacillota bacterium]HOB87604.1 YgiQ family radical SAM protein [Bacillota bacterium]HOP68811.1 YgiQ family radical SAM protein [Bacillota bacterium]HPT34129.1 YgiQ family radical SAM protein [Bacillota bacterium]HPZ65386.1 YgiQ family radical SAM protein [Bacillota bacterium]